MHSTVIAACNYLHFSKFTSFIKINDKIYCLLVIFETFALNCFLLEIVMNVICDICSLEINIRIYEYRREN